MSQPLLQRRRAEEFRARNREGLPEEILEEASVIVERVRSGGPWAPTSCFGTSRVRAIQPRPTGSFKESGAWTWPGKEFRIAAVADASVALRFGDQGSTVGGRNAEVRPAELGKNRDVDGNNAAGEI